MRGDFIVLKELLESILRVRASIWGLRESISHR